MRVVVDLGSPSPGTTLVEPEDFKTFKLVCKGHGDTESLQNALGGFGSVGEDGPHVWLSIERLKTLAGALASDPDWIRRLDEMVGYAEANGWLSADGTFIRAHVERPTSYLEEG